jgi:hypothetical protein
MPRFTRKNFPSLAELMAAERQGIGAAESVPFVDAVYRNNKVVRLEEVPGILPCGRDEELICLKNNQKATLPFIAQVFHEVQGAFEYLTDEKKYSLKEMMPMDTWESWSNNTRRLAGSIFVTLVILEYLPFRLKRRPAGTRGTNLYHFTGPVVFTWP